MDIALGSMYFGTRVDEATSFALLDRFVEAGGRWIDTADCYAFWADPSGSGGQSETVIGRWLASRPGMRNRVSISTKVGADPLVPGRWPDSAEGLSPKAIRAGLDGSLRRLGTDRVELLWTHMEDRGVELAETVEALGELVTTGAVGRVGCSNHPMWKVERARRLARDRGLPPYTALQLRYSYLQPRPLAPLPDEGHHLVTPEVLDYVLSEDLWLWAYTPLINGGYTRADRPLPEAYDHPGTTRRLAALGAVAAELGATANQVVLAWLTGGQPPILPIVGVSTVAQLDEALAPLELTSQQRARLDAVT